MLTIKAVPTVIHTLAAFCETVTTEQAQAIVARLEQAGILAAMFATPTEDNDTPNEGNAKFRESSRGGG